MKIVNIERNSALLVIDIQQEDFEALNDKNIDEPRWDCIRNAKRVLMSSAPIKCPLFRSKKCIAPIWLTLGVNWTAVKVCIALKPIPD